MSSKYAAGLQQFTEYADKISRAPAVKGQIIGPVSFGLNVTTPDGRPVMYDETMRDALVKNLQVKMRYQEQLLRKLNPETIILIDESSLDIIYSPYIGYDEEKAKHDLGAMLGVLEGMGGIHCCANTNWPFLLDMADILSFDAYNFSDQFLIDYGAIERFLGRAGIITWGIVPTSDDVFKESAANLVSRLESVFRYLSGRGIKMENVLGNSLITPVCGLGTKSEQIMLRAFELTREVSFRLKQKYSI
jgi:hypothetical protein